MPLTQKVIKSVNWRNG